MIPTNSKEITAVWLTNALHNGGVIGQETAVTSVTTTPIGEDESFTGGQLIRCQLTYTSTADNHPASLVAKLSPTDPELRAVFKNNNKREISLYTDLAAQSNLPIPQCYHGAFDDETGATILLLQDLTDYRIVEFATGCDLSDARHVVQALAIIHAQFWNDPRVQPLVGVDALDDFPMDNLWSQYPAAVAELLPDLVIPPELFAIGDIAMANIVPLLNQMFETAPITCVHRDSHVDNILFSDAEDDVPALILDWQSIGKGRGVYDIAYFLISSVPIELRRQAEQELLHAYHATLSDHGIENYSFEECWFDYRLASTGKLIGTIIATVLLDNTPPFKRAWRQTDLQRLLAFFEDHDILSFLTALTNEWKQA